MLMSAEFVLRRAMVVMDVAVPVLGQVFDECQSGFILAVPVYHTELQGPASWEGALGNNTPVLAEAEVVADLGYIFRNPLLR